MKKLSFCITCKNRLHQISKTLPVNLKDNIDDQDDIEFVIVDFSSTDGLKEWILQTFRSELSSGYLKLYYTEDMPVWHCSVAKNTAHLVASGEILVNLDCDNYTGQGGGRFVLDQFNIHGLNIILHQTSAAISGGSFGRISMLKKYFKMIGGYDEAFNPMGYQDTDLIKRLVSFGLFYVVKNDGFYNKAIPNSKEESIRNTGSKKTYQLMNEENMLLSKKNIAQGKIVSNDRKMGINGLVRVL